MTPFEIDIMLHYYAHADDHPGVSLQSPLWRETVKQFIDAGLVVYLHESERDNRFPQTYQITEKGRAYCEMLQRVKLPEQVWVSPERAEMLRRDPS